MRTCAGSDLCDSFSYKLPPSFSLAHVRYVDREEVIEESKNKQSDEEKRHGRG